MTEVLCLCFDEQLAKTRTSLPAQQLDAHLSTIAGVAGTLAAALAASGEESLSECAYFLELDLQRLRDLLAKCSIALTIEEQPAEGDEQSDANEQDKDIQPSEVESTT